jgi:Tfp pilus assembly protein PilX
MSLGGRRSLAPGAQRGMTLLLVLVLLSVMLLGGLAFSRMAEVGTLVAGNMAAKERALQASEVGINTAYAQVQALGDENADSGTWYFAQARAVSAQGLPQGIDWDAAPEIRVGSNDEFRVRYVVDRQCSVALVADPEQQCLLRQADTLNSAKAGAETIDPPSGKQFRVTVRVTGPKDTSSFVQALVTRGMGPAVPAPPGIVP